MSEAIKNDAASKRSLRDSQKRAVTWLMVVGSIALFPSGAPAAERFWVNTSGGDWLTPNNWAATANGTPPASVPKLPGDVARFEIGNTQYTVTFASAVDISLQTLNVNSDSIALKLDNSTMAITGINIGDGRVQQGGGKLLLSGGVVNTGDVSVGFGTTDLFLLQPAELSIENGARLAAVAGDLRIGAETDSVGRPTPRLMAVNVVGPATLMAMRDAFIGLTTGGTLNVLNQGNILFSGDMILGDGGNAVGSVNIEGVGSNVSCEGTVTVGRQGIGLLHIATGGSLNSLKDTLLQGGTCGTSCSTTADAVVDGGTWVSDQSIYVGGDATGPRSGIAEIQLKAGGVIQNQGTLQVWSPGTLSLSGGDLHTHDLQFDVNAGLNALAGSVTVDGGQFRFKSRDTLELGGVDPLAPVEFAFINGADAAIRFSWGVGTAHGTHGATTVSGVSAAGVRSTLVSQLTAGELVVGGRGTGTMQVLDGALVEIGENVIVGKEATGVGVLEVGGVAGGFRATVRPRLSVGFASIVVGGQPVTFGGGSGGDGTLRVFDGGLVESRGRLFIAHDRNSHGNVSVDSQNGSPAEIHVSDDLFVAGSASESGGTGTLRIAQGGLVQVADVLKVWNFGSIDLDGGTIRTNHLDLFFAAPDALNFPAGRLEANRIIGSFVSGGTLAPRNSIATMTINGSYEQLAGAELEIEVAGSVPGTEHDVLTVASTATLGGALHVITDPAFTPAAGEVFTILTSGARVGRFSELIITGPIRYSIVYVGNDVTLVADRCLGFEGTPDTDGDGVPDACDACPGFDDALDADGDAVPDGCDTCPGFDDTQETDGDGVPDGCDVCPGFDDALDADGDGVPDDCDICSGFDDTVDTDGDGVPDGCDDCPDFGTVRNLTQNTLFTTIQSAIDAAAAGDVLEADPCTYHEIIDFSGKAITLRSTDPTDPAVVAATIIDATGVPDPGDGVPVVRCDNGEGPATVLDGLTITGGSGDTVLGGPTFPVGGGILLVSNPTVTNCIVSGNTAVLGGGMFIFGNSPTVTNCVFQGNSAFEGAGMYNESSSPTLTNCIFSENMIFIGDGGGVYNSGSSPTVVSCAFIGNFAERGGGMFNAENGAFNGSSNPTLRNCTFSANNADFFEGGGGMYNTFDSTANIANSIFWMNSDGGGMGESAQISDEFPFSARATRTRAVVTYSTIQGGWTGGGGTGNIDADPLFVDGDGADNVVGTADDDLRLSPGSPCIDTADNRNVVESTDLEGNTRVVGCAVDMGAYENQAAVIPLVRNLTQGTNFGAIQLAIDAAVTNDVIEAAPCTHNEIIDFHGKAITLRSIDPTDPAVVAATILDASGVADPGDGRPVVRCDSGEGPDTVLDGFTITGGTGDTGLFGSISPMGGGMFNNNASPTVTHCTFVGNTALGGGGMFNRNNTSLVANCKFLGNRAVGFGGGGGMLNEFSAPVVANCLFSGNTSANDGGAMLNDFSAPLVTNCTLNGNAAADGFGGGMYSVNKSNPTVTNCIAWGNVDLGGMDESAQIHLGFGAGTVNFSDVQGGWTGSGANNINADPLFVDADGTDNIIGTGDDDVRLPVGSPCINVGDSSVVTEPTDLDGNSRIISCAVDMGAYEQQTITDSDGDGLPNGCELCLGNDATGDSDGDRVCDDIDACPGFDDRSDADADGVPDGCDVCPGADDAVDADADTVPDGCDLCSGFDDRADADGDGVPDGCDVCEGFDDGVDSDADGVADGCDRCEGFDDTIDSDADGQPDGCDACPGFDDKADADGDGVPDDCDICVGFDDTVDTDGDGVPDGCDVCRGFDDNLDANANGIPDDCELPCDIDFDGDVDLLDYAICVSCMTGPINTQPLNALCVIADLDLDNDIDMFDWADCQAAFTGGLQSDPLTTTVTGLIHTPDGSPVPDARVMLADDSLSTISMGDGRFFLLNVLADLSEISVVASVVLQGEDFRGSARESGLVGGGITDIGTITVHRVANWVSLADGLWSDGGNWDTGLPPIAGQSVIIDVTNADPTVTHDTAVSFNGPLGSLMCNERLRLDGGTLAVAGTFQMNNTLELARGNIVGTIIDLGPGASILVPSGNQPVLDGVTINGTMQMPGVPAGSAVHVRNGLTLNGLITLNGSITSGDAIRLDEPNRMIDGNGRIEFLRAGQNTVTQLNTNGASDLGVLTIGPGIMIHGAGGVVGQAGNVFPASIVNDGTIDSDQSSGIVVSGNGSINNGTFRSSFGPAGLLRIVGPWTNNGLVHADGGAFLVNDSWTNNGTLRLGPGPVFESQADFVQSASGSFISEITSTANEGYGQMAVVGTATLDGVLRVEFDNVFAPSVGQSFTVLSYGNHVGEFATIETVGLDPTFTVVSTYNATVLELVIQLQ